MGRGADFQGPGAQTLYNLAGEQVEIRIRDRFSFMLRFLGLGLEDAVPDGTTLWLYRERLAAAALKRRACSAFRQVMERSAAATYDEG